MNYVAVDSLKAHEKNSYFFDDMSGSKWSEFIESIRTSGVIEPIVVTRDFTIVSGHQRVRACKELGITEIPARVKDYTDEDAIIKDLLETNVRQRGNIDGSALKLGRIITELERIYGIHHGGDRTSTSHNGNLKSQDELFDMLGISSSSYHRAKNLIELIPELQDSLEDGFISATAASNLLARLSKEEQIAVFAAMPKDVKLSQREVQEYIDEIREEDAEDFEDMQQRIKETKLELEKTRDELHNAKIEVSQVRREMERADRDVAGEMMSKLNLSELKLRDEYEKHAKTKEQLRSMASENFELKAQKRTAEGQLEVARKKLDELKSVEESGLSIDNQKKMEELYRQISSLEKKCIELEHEKENLSNKQLLYSCDIEELLRFTENACNVIDMYSRDGSTIEMVVANPEVKNKVETRVNTLMESAKRILKSLCSMEVAVI